MEAEESRTSKAYTLIITQNYYDNLSEIVDFIALENKQPSNAINIGDGINNVLKKIAHNPFIYAECENLITDNKVYREAPYKSWLIVFKVINYEITILGVLSGKRSSLAFKKISKNK